MRNDARGQCGVTVCDRHWRVSHNADADCPKRRRSAVALEASTSTLSLAVTSVGIGAHGSAMNKVVCAVSLLAAGRSAMSLPRPSNRSPSVLDTSRVSTHCSDATFPSRTPSWAGAGGIPVGQLGPHGPPACLHGMCTGGLWPPPVAYACGLRPRSANMVLTGGKMRRALRIAPSQSVSVGLASACAKWSAHPMMTMDHSRMLSSSTRPALKPSTGLRWRSDVSSRHALGTAVFCLVHVPLVASARYGHRWSSGGSGATQLSSANIDGRCAESDTTTPPLLPPLPFLPSTPSRRDRPSGGRGSVAHSPSSCFLRISEELAVALLAGESGRLDPGRDEG